MQSLMEWGLGVADEWKERTRLDARGSFKVLDQSLASQMRASEAEPEKLLRRCTPPTGRHQVCGSSAELEADKSQPTADEGDQNIFDDRDFYVQLLREVMSSGSKAGGDESR